MNSDTKYHNHSFASYVLDHLVQNSELPWKDIKLMNNSNHYNQFEVMKKVETMGLQNPLATELQGMQAPK